MAKEGYKAEVIWSTRELTKLEKLSFSQSPDCVPLDIYTADSAQVIEVDYALLLDIHNEHNRSGNPDYQNTYVVDTEGTVYKTSSQSFTANLMEIADALQDELSEGQPFPPIKVYQKESKNMKGKNFITCTVYTGPLPVKKYAPPVADHGGWIITEETQDTPVQ